MTMRFAYPTSAAYALPHHAAPGARRSFWLTRLLDLAALWRRRAEERRALRQIDDHMLRDIGLDRLQAERMAARPFWRA